MAAPRQNRKADAMYKLYQQGHSLAQVARAFGITRQSIYKMFAARDFQLRQRVTPLPFVIFDGRHYTLRHVGYYGCTEGKRGYLHRHAWEKANGAIPKGFDIHHINHDRTDNRLENLELISRSEHAIRYPSRQNQHTKKRP